MKPDGSVKDIVAKDHQRELAQDALGILVQSDHAYLEAPPASGKTLVVAMIAEGLTHADAYYLAHTIDLVDQAKREMALYRKLGLVGREVRWHFMTRASYANMARRGEITRDAPHVAFVDECHIGGNARQSRQRPKVQFPAIVATSDKVVWISATPWELDEGIMGARENNSSQLPFDEAFRRGALNDTDVVRVDCSLDLRVRLADDARRLHRAERDEYHVVGETADDQHRSLDDIMHGIAQRGLRVADVPALVHHRHRLMADLYHRRHDGEKAIFWLPSRQHARDCAAYIDEITGRPGCAAAILGETKGSEADIETSARLADWLNGGATKAVCVVYRLREGFDDPEAALGFDCSWNPYNHRNAVQKIGRLTRKAPGKGVGRYYYAVDAVTIAGAGSRSFSRRFLRNLGRAYAQADIRLGSDAFDDMTGILDAVGATGRQQSLPLIEHIALLGHRVRMASTPLFDVLKSRGTAIRIPMGFEELMERSVSAALEKLVRDIEMGRKAAPDMNARGEGNMLRRVATPSSSTYNPAIRDRLIAAGALKPVPSREEVDRRLDEVVSAIEAGTLVMRNKDETHRFLWKYISPVNNSFRPEIRARLIACGAYRENALRGRRKSPVYDAVEAKDALHPDATQTEIARMVMADGVDSPINTLRDYAQRARRARLAASATS